MQRLTSVADARSRCDSKLAKFLAALRMKFSTVDCRVALFCRVAVALRQPYSMVPTSCRLFLGLSIIAASTKEVTFIRSLIRSVRVLTELFGEEVHGPL